MIKFFYIIFSVTAALKIIEKSNCDYFGNDLKENGKVLHFMTNTFKNCTQKCVSKSNCTHFIWSKNYGCYLKHAQNEIDIQDSFRPVTVVKCGIIKDRLLNQNVTKMFQDPPNGLIYSLMRI